jgi:single-strand DNA-binding protein
MSGSVNKVILVGNLGADPEMRVTPTGLQVANLRVATKEVWNDKTSGQKQERTDWHRVVAYDRLASICERYLSKGQLVYIEGSLQTRSWDDKETGQKRYMTEIKARDMRMLGGRREGSSPGTAPGGAPTGEPEMPGTPEADDDVPF